MANHTSEIDTTSTIQEALNRMIDVSPPQTDYAQGSNPDCPFCGKEADMDFGCEHLTGVWTYWWSDDDTFDSAAENATHYMSYTTQIGGECIYFFKE